MNERVPFDRKECIVWYVAELRFEGNFVADFEKNILSCFRILRHFGIKWELFSEKLKKKTPFISVFSNTWKKGKRIK